jgi:hypothetical protein
MLAASVVSARRRSLLARSWGPIGDGTFVLHAHEAVLDTLADAEGVAALTALFETGLASGEDRIGIAARQAADGIRFVFPV